MTQGPTPAVISNSCFACDQAENLTVEVIGSFRAEKLGVGLIEVEARDDTPLELTTTAFYLDFAQGRRTDRCLGYHLRDTRRVEVPFDDLMFIPPGQRFLIPAPRRKLRSMFCSFGQVSPVPQAQDGRAMGERFGLRGSWIRDIMARLLREFSSPSFGSAVMVETLCEQLPIEMQRYYAQPPHKEGTRGGTLSALQLRQIEDWLHAGSGTCRLPALAADLGLSVRHLSRLYRATTGHTLSSQLGRAHLDRAKKLLAAGDPIKVVAWSCGFKSPPAFSTAFKRATGLTPREYRLRFSL